MRKIDKKINLQKVNLLCEQRYLANKSSITEEKDWNSFIDNVQNLSDNTKDLIKLHIKDTRYFDSDQKIIDYIENKVRQENPTAKDLKQQELIKNREAKKREKTDYKNASYEEKVEYITNNITLFGKKISRVLDEGIRFEDYSYLVVDYDNRDSIIYDDDANGIRKQQYCVDKYDYENSKAEYERNPNDNNVIFNNKKEARVFFNILTTACNLYFTKKIKLKYTYTPDDKPTI